MEVLDLNNTNPNFRIKKTYAVGVDLGQSHDPTAIAIVERISGAIVPHWRNSYTGTNYRPLLHVRHLERLPLGLKYDEQVLYVAAMLRREPLTDDLHGVYIDYTGVGRAVYDMFDSARLPKLFGIGITGGKESNCNGSLWTVPKSELVSLVQAKLHSGELIIADSLPDAEALKRELQDFRVAMTSAGNMTFNAREGSHDDLVLALCMAVIGLEEKRKIVVQSC